MVAVYGASGCTGWLLAAELVCRRVPFVLVRRSAECLRAVAQLLGDAAGAVAAATLDAPASLR